MGLLKRKNSKKSKVIKSAVDKTRVIDKYAPFMIQETYKSLRTNLMFAMQSDGEGGKVIVFTSAIPSEGKTTVCINTAITFAQTGAKVMIIDSDLRIPKLHKYFDIDGKVGLSNVLGGFVNCADVITHIEKYNIDCIPGGHIPPNPAELLSSKAMEDTLSELKSKYDYIFIDTPPVTIVTDAVSIAPHACGVALVVREKYTPHAAVSDVLKTFRFANVKVLGIIDNCSKSSDASYGGRYGAKRLFSYRSHYYKYGGGYYGYGAKSLEEK